MALAVMGVAGMVRRVGLGGGRNRLMGVVPMMRLVVRMVSVLPGIMRLGRGSLDHKEEQAGQQRQCAASQGRHAGPGQIAHEGTMPGSGRFPQEVRQKLRNPTCVAPKDEIASHYQLRYDPGMDGRD